MKKGVAACQGWCWKLGRSVVILMPRALMAVGRVCLTCGQSALSPAVQPDICCIPGSSSGSIYPCMGVYVEMARVFHCAGFKPCLGLFSQKRTEASVMFSTDEFGANTCLQSARNLFP